MRASSPSTAAQSREISGVALLTITHNEATLLPLWLRWATRTFAPDDVYLIDHDTTDGSVSVALAEYPGLSVFPVHHDRYMDITWLHEQAQEHFARLLEDYQYVLYLDVDEVLVVDPRCGVSLAEYLALVRAAGPRYVRFSTRSILHMPGEPSLDLSRPILGQRSWWFTEPLYHKPALAREKLNWMRGFHFLTTDVDERGDMDLSTLIVEGNVYLLHLRRMDYEICQRKRAQTQAEVWGGGDAGEAEDHRRTGSDFDDWFYEPLRHGGEMMEITRGLNLEPINEAFRSAF